MASIATSAHFAATYARPQGPGDARPTARAIVEHEGLVGGALKGKVVLITGCSSGIGVETARALHLTGARLFLAVRDLPKGERVVADILASNAHVPGVTASIELVKLSLDSLQSVRECAAEFLSRSKVLNVLINNAGVMTCPEGTTRDGFETHFGVNHLGHFLLFELLRPALLASSTPAFHSRVVTVTSLGHRFSPVRFDDLDLKRHGYHPFIAYGQSKTANIYLATEIERRFGGQGLHGLAVHPGFIMDTELARHVDLSVLRAMAPPGVELLAMTPQQGAATTVWAAVSREWEGKSGEFLENCGRSSPRGAEEVVDPTKPGYAPYAYDEAAARRLWDLSLTVVALLGRGTRRLCLTTCGSPPPRPQWPPLLRRLGKQLDVARSTRCGRLRCP